MTAHWEAKTYNLTLNYNDNVNENNTITVTYDDQYNLGEPSRDGYTFKGWYDANSNVFATTGIYKKTEGITLTAHWEAITYTISYNTNGGDDLDESTATYDSPYNLSTPTRTGYTFVKWQKDGEDFVQGDTFTFTNNITLTAVWTPNTYNLILDYNYTNEPSNATRENFFTYDATYNITEVPGENYPTGYHFDGWYADEDCTQEFSLSGTYQTDGNTTLYAKWAPDKYGLTLYYNYDGAPNNEFYTKSDYFTYDATYNITEVPDEKDYPTGYRFAGWYSDADCTDGNLWNSGSYTNPDDLVLYAKWTAQKYMVTFSVATGVNLDTQSKEVTFDSPYGELPTPTLAGYVFTGWYTTQYDGSLVSHSTIVSTAQAHTLYAHWTGADVTIHFNSNGGSEVADVTRQYQANYNEPALPTPTKEGYLFIGWYLEDGTLVTNNTIVNLTTAHTLTASWAEADVPYLVVGNNWNILSEEANNDYRFKLGQDGHYHLSNIRVVAESSFQDGETTMYQASVTIFLNGVFYGVEETTVLRTTENGNFGRFTANSSERATIQSAEMLTRWFNFDLYEESTGTWQLSISCGKQGNPTEVDNTESEQQARAKKYIEDGKVFIQTKEDRIYNASGQLVK